MARKIKIEVFTDVVCPWCLIGSVRLDKAIADLPRDVEVEVENHPFYLDASTPAEGVAVAEMLREKYGREPKEMWALPEAEARKSGIALDLSRQPRMYPTARAHTIARLAKRLGTQHALANAIAEAYFLELKQINDDAVLAEIAARLGFERDEALRLLNDAEELAITEQLAQSAARQGISGVPLFIFDNTLAISGAQPEGVFKQAFDQVLAARAAAQ